MFAYNLLTNVLPAGLRPYAKAVWPLIVAIVVAGASWVDSGTFDSAEIGAAVSGLVASLLAFAAPNKAAPTYTSDVPVVPPTPVK